MEQKQKSIRNQKMNILQNIMSIIFLAGGDFYSKMGGHEQGFYYSKESIEYDFDIKIA